MIDLYFADEKTIKQYSCSTCPEAQQKQRRCKDDGFNNLAKPKSIDDAGLKLTFCPGKATWYPEIVEAFAQCFIAYKSGILPKPGGIEDQSPIFSEVFYTFVERYEARRYVKVWKDVGEFAHSVLEAIAKMFGGK